MEHIVDVDYLVSSPHTQQLELMNMMLQLQQLAEAELSPNLNAHLSTPPPPLDDFSHSFGYQHAQTSLPPPPSPTLPNSNVNIPAPAAVANDEAMREMMFRIAAMQPVDVDPETLRRPTKRRNVRISKDPQSVAARLRRERISERMRILQHMVPGGTKMDTASMLDEAIQYVKFLKTQVQSLERAAAASQLRVPGRLQTMYQTQEHGFNIYAIANPYN